MPVRHVGRRQFLLGTGGAVLAIPFLHSLAPSRAQAQAPDGRFFVAFMTTHGGVWPENMYPGEATLNNTHSIYSDHQMRWGRLQVTESGGQSMLSKVLRSPSGTLPQSLVDKMMIVRGLDTATHIGHNSAGPLGNYERANGRDNTSLYVPTIDQVLANWSGFYGAGDPYVMKSMHVGNGLSWIERSSGVQEVAPATSPDVLFQSVLSNVRSSEPQAAAPSRTHVLNRVVQHYNKLVNGAFGDARRLGENDKARLNDHMDMVSDLVRRLGPSSLTACDPQTGNTGNTDNKDAMYSPAYADLKQWHQDYNAVFAAAIACGASRIGTVFVGNTFHQNPSFTVDWEQWHHPIAHRAVFTEERWAREGDLPEHPQETLVTAKNNFYRDTYVDLIRRLDGVDAGDGTSLLDQGMVMWAQESGPYTHHGDSLPIVTAGSVGGYFNTGHYFDLRNRNASVLPGDSEGNSALHSHRRPGILYNQWLSNILQSMGMSPGEFYRDHAQGWAGYGCAETQLGAYYPQRVFNDANDKIPKVTSGT